jgi:hypothetical protein
MSNDDFFSGGGMKRNAMVPKCTKGTPEQSAPTFSYPIKPLSGSVLSPNRGTWMPMQSSIDT